MSTVVNIWTAEAVAAVKEYGKIIGESQMCGTKVPVQGQMLALMAMSEGISITEVRRRYHIVNGCELSMRADYMRAEFRRLGGTYRWVNNGEDGKVAILNVKFKENEETVSYSIEDAQREGLVKPGSRWTKAPGDMLRARVSTKAIRMVCTEVLAGFATDEEIEASVVEPAGFLAAQPQTTEATVTKTAPADEPVTPTASVVVSSEATTATASVANAQVDLMIAPEQLNEILTLFATIPVSEASQQKALAKRNVKSVTELTAAQADEMIAGLRKFLPTTAGSTSLNVSGPITQELVASIQEAIKIGSQVPGGAAINEAVKAHLDKYGATLSGLTVSQGEVLLKAIETKQVDLFLALALEQTSPKNS